MARPSDDGFYTRPYIGQPPSDVVAPPQQVTPDGLSRPQSTGTAYSSRNGFQEHWLPSSTSNILGRPQFQQPLPQQSPIYGATEFAPGAEKVVQYPQPPLHRPHRPPPPPPPLYGHTQHYYQQYSSDNSTPSAYNYNTVLPQQYQLPQAFQQSARYGVVQSPALVPAQPQPPIATNRDSSYSAPQQSHAQAHAVQDYSPQLPLPLPSSQLTQVAQKTEQLESLPPLARQRSPSDAYGPDSGQYTQPPVRPQLPLPHSSSSLFSRFLNPLQSSPKQPTRALQQQLPPLSASQSQTFDRAPEAMRSPSMGHSGGRQDSVSQAPYLPYISQTPGGTHYRQQYARQETSQSSLLGEYRQPQYNQPSARRLEPSLPPSSTPISFGRSSEYSAPKYDESRTQQQPPCANQKFQGGLQDYRQPSPLEPATRPPLPTFDPPLKSSEPPQQLHQVFSLEQYHRSQQQYHRGSMTVQSPALSQFQRSPRSQSHQQGRQSPSTPLFSPLAMTTPYYNAEGHVPLLAPDSPHKSPKSMTGSPLIGPPSLPSVLSSDTHMREQTTQLELARRKSSIAALVSPPLSADERRSVSVPSLNQATPHHEHTPSLPPDRTHEPQQSTAAKVSPRLPSPAYIATGAAFPPAESVVSSPSLNPQQHQQSSTQNSQELKATSADAFTPLLVLDRRDSVSGHHESATQRDFKKRKASESSENVRPKKLSGEGIVRERFRAIAPTPCPGKQPVDEASSGVSSRAPTQAVTPRPLRKPLPVLAPAPTKSAEMAPGGGPALISVSAPLKTATVPLVSSVSGSSSSSSTLLSSSSSPWSARVALKPEIPASSELVAQTVVNPPGPEQTSAQQSYKATFAKLLPRLTVPESSMPSSISPATVSPTASLSEQLHAPNQIPTDSVLVNSSLSGTMTTTSSTSTVQIETVTTSPIAAATTVDYSSNPNEQKNPARPCLAESVSSQLAVVSERSNAVFPEPSELNKEAVVPSIPVQQKSSTLEPLANVKNSEPASAHDSTPASSVDGVETIMTDARSGSPYSVSTPSPPESTAKGVIMKKMRMGPKSTSTRITVVPISHKRMTEVGDSDRDGSDEEDDRGDSQDSDSKIDVDEGGESENEPLIRSVKRQKISQLDEASESKSIQGERQSSTVSCTSESPALDGRSKSKFEHNFSAEAAFNELIAAGKNLRKALTLTAPATSEDRETSNPKKQLDFTEVALHNGREHVAELKVARDKRDLCRQAWLRSVIKGRAELSSKNDNSILRLRQWLKWWWTDIAARHSENQLHGSWGKRTQISKAWQAAYDVSASIVHARLRQCERVYELQYRCGWPALVLATMATPAFGPTQRMRKSHLERGCDATQISQKDWSEFIVLAESRINEIRSVVLNQCGYDGIRRILEKAAVTKPFAMQGLALFPPYSYPEDAETIVVMPRTMMRNSRVVFDKRKKNKKDEKR
ncbi:uncharacterized protein V1513DRAFT_452856 [Lipomyces chichibuensis]|uniref:uncharacterized protein n=1 Tax=Lipomyces chichibuensis TaxID=1546026 RepID=UPI003343AFD1